MSGARAERQRLVKKLIKQGFIVTRTGSGHWQVRPPEGEGVVTMAFSPRSPADYNTKKYLRQIGFTE
jgi:predicted RNA binding protein YcfA (HicA-like mRNA interferase family)